MMVRTLSKPTGFRGLQTGGSSTSRHPIGHTVRILVHHDVILKRAVAHGLESCVKSLLAQAVALSLVCSPIRTSLR